MNKVIFLDLDGVLNSYDYMHASNAVNRETGEYDIMRDNYGQKFDPRCVLWLDWILRKTDAKIVISSSWKMDGLGAMEFMWQARRLPGEIIDITPDAVNEYDGSRGREIEMWLEKHDVYAYCIIDDNTDMLQSQLENFVKTDMKYGLNRETAYDVITILNKKTPIT